MRVSPATPLWCAAATERLTAQLCAVQSLRLLRVAMELLYCERFNMSMQQINADEHENVSAALSPQNFLNSFILVKGRVMRAMNKLRSLSLRLCELTGGNSQLSAHLHAALYRWEASAEIFNRDDGFHCDRAELVAVLDDITVCVEGALLELCSDGKPGLFDNPAVVVFTKKADKVRGESIRGTSRSRGWYNGYSRYGAAGVFLALSRWLGLDLSVILSTTVLRSLLATFTVVVSIPVVRILLDLDALSSAGSSIFLGSNRTVVLAPYYTMNAVWTFLFALQLVLLMGMGFVFLILLSNASSNLAYAAVLQALCVQGAACVQWTGSTPSGVDDVFNKKGDDGEKDMSLTARNAFTLKKDSNPLFPATHHPCGEAYARTLCGGAPDAGLPQQYPYGHFCHNQAFCASPVASAAGCHGPKAALPDTVEIEKETSPPSPEVGDRDCFFYLRCMQAERESQKLFTEAPSGVGDKYKESSAVSSKPDSTARICCHLTENLQDCVCPLLIVEYVPRTKASGENFKPRELKERYPVVYCNLPALELLHYRCITDLAGKDLEDIFRLYRNPRRLSHSKRGKRESIASALPALPQRQRQNSQGRPIIVPLPPSKEQGQWEKSQTAEKIADLRWLFKNGVEELLTAQVLHNSLHFDVYAMSIGNITLPFSFCDERQSLNTPPSTEKMYLVLLFLRETYKEAKDAPWRFSNSHVCGESAPQAATAHEYPMGELFSTPMQKRASTANSVTSSLFYRRGSLMSDGEPASKDPQVDNSRRRRSTRTAPTGHARAKRRSTVKWHSSTISAERGHAVDHVTAQLLQEKLSSLFAIHEVELSSCVPEAFLINFVALMIFVNWVLKRYKRVNCLVDSENMFILLKLRAIDDVPLLKSNSQTLREGTILPSGSDATNSESRRRSSHDAGVESLLSANLLEYLRVCDANIQFTANGCTLCFPYTTQERLALIEDAGTLQLSTLRGLSLFGVTVTNALTEDAVAQTSGKMVQLQQYAAAEKPFSEAVCKAKLGPSRKTEEKNLNDLSNLKRESVSKPDYNSSFSGAFAAPLVQPVEEMSGISMGSMARLPQIFSNEHSKTTDPTAHAVTVVSALESRSGFDVSQGGSPEWFSVSTFARFHNIFGRPPGRSWSDPMAASVSSHSLLGGKVTSYSKRYLHFFLYMKENREDVVQHLWSRGHSATMVSDPMAMKRYLFSGMDAFDVVFIEWSEKLVTPEICELIYENAGSKTTILYVLNEDACFVPLPPDTPDESVLRLRDIGEVFTNPTIGRNLSLYIRQRQLRHEMVQIRWRKSYQIVRQIGGGAFGDVYEVYLFVSRGRLAMKRLFLNGASNRLLEQLNREVLIMSQMDHPNIVSFSHSSMEDNAYCIFMELCDGTLGQRLQRGSATMQDSQRLQKPPLQRLSNGAPFPLQPDGNTSNRPDAEPDEVSKIPEPLTAREIVLVLRDIASGIAYMHSKGIVHRDIKPCNILFCNGVAKIGDFGSAAEECTAKPLVNMKGTLAYMSPEVLLGEPYGRPCDMWSFGCLLAEIIGLRLGHLQGLHFPALVELYKSIPQAGSLPITVANYKGGKLQHHFGTTTTQRILGAMKDACHDAYSKRGGSPTQRRCVTSAIGKDRLQSSENQALSEDKFQSSMGCDSARAVTYITSNSTTFLGSEKAELPESLVELLENLLRRDPKKRMTAEEVLHHPTTWDVEWMEMVVRAVEEVCSLDTDDALVDASQGETSAEREENLDLSISSV
ncbi:protein kinase [Trypanosoma rangeli SC58]|uniref:non-specific serine/threonine protein kinase n=1 Tax=Trypanosoma rangeli SC58 TaxID=429131 RepID=A0A061J2C0_TRYRA|nr:protein kinase [Trypanosoma rangeli SC58]